MSKGTSLMSAVHVGQVGGHQGGLTAVAAEQFDDNDALVAAGRGARGVDGFKLR